MFFPLLSRRIGFNLISWNNFVREKNQFVEKYIPFHLFLSSYVIKSWMKINAENILAGDLIDKNTYFTFEVLARTFKRFQDTNDKLHLIAKYHKWLTFH